MSGWKTNIVLKKKAKQFNKELIYKTGTLLILPYQSLM